MSEVAEYRLILQRRAGRLSGGFCLLGAIANFLAARSRVRLYWKGAPRDRFPGCGGPHLPSLLTRDSDLLTLLYRRFVQQTAPWSNLFSRGLLEFLW